MNSVNGNGKPLGPIPMRGPAGGAVVGQGQTIDLRQCIRDASIGAGQIVRSMVEDGVLQAGLEAVTYQVAMELLLEPIKAGIHMNAQMQVQQAMLRAQGIIG